MKFYEALKEVLENGKKARRRDWLKHDYIYASDGRIFCESGNYLYSPATPSLTSDDWEIVKEKVKKTRTVWINCYKTSLGMVHASEENATDCPPAKDFLFTKEVTFEWEEEG